MNQAIRVRFGWAFLAAWACAVTVAEAQQPGTRPASSDDRQRVLVLPLEPLSGDQDAALAEAVARSLALDLSRFRNLHAIRGEKVAADQAAALEAGREADASHVVWGTLQRVDGRIRISGQVLDLQRGAPAGHFKLTGSFREMFELQDLLAEQVRRRLEHGAASTQPDGAAADGQTRPSREAAAEVPRGESLRVRPHPLDSDDLAAAPDWLTPNPWRGQDDLRYDYYFAPYPYLALPYFGYGRWPFGHRHGYPPFGHWHGYPPLGYEHVYGGYHYSFYRPYRPLYQHRYHDYTFRGIPDRRSYRGFGPRFLRSFTGPVPLHWYYVE